MKKTSHILHWLTLFVSSVGVCAFLSVCFILIYSEVFGSFSPKKKDVTSPVDIAESRIDDNHIARKKFDDMPTTGYQKDTLSDAHTDKIIEFTQDEDITDDWTFDGQDTAKPSVNEDIEEHTVPDENVVNTIPSNSEQQIAPKSSKESFEETAYIPESTSQDNIVEPATKPADTTENNNFNTYDNEAQQQGDDLYVLNTSSMKIHHKTCDSVRKIAPQNYSTSNLSANELTEQGYSLCGICFK